MIYCADDFGLDPAANSAILDLCEKEKIQAVSVLVYGVTRESADSLKIYNANVKIGLHLNLFENFSLEASLEIDRQINQFEGLFNKFPDFIDGHMHCHIYPDFGAKLIKVLKKRALSPGFFVRSTVLHVALKKKNSLMMTYFYLIWIHFLGMRFQKKLHRAKIKTNDYCWGAFAHHAKIDEVFSTAREFGLLDDVFFFHPASGEVEGHVRRQDYEFALNKL